jgi:hypothetical protein
METVTLNNGAVEAKIAVQVVMMTLKGLSDEGLEGILAIYDLAKMSEPKSTYKPFGANGEKLQRLALINEQGEVHDTVRNVVLSAVKMDPSGLDFSLVNPIKAQPTPSTPGI